LRRRDHIAQPCTSAKQQRGRHYRELYRALRDVLLADAAPPATDPDHDSDRPASDA
jgi:hypothetical protein